MIKVFSANERTFATNGLGTVAPISCIEEKLLSLNGWKVEVTANIKDREKLIKDNIILVKTKEKGAQAFRIGDVKKTDRRISFTANHISFDAEFYVLADVRPEMKGPVEFLEYCNSRTDTQSPFTFDGDAVGVATHYFIRKTLMDVMQQCEAEYECIFDIENYNVRIMHPTSVGADNGFSVVYGKNIQGVTVEEDWSEVCTKVLPVGSNGITLPETYVESDLHYDVPYTRVVEFDTATEDADGNAIDLDAQRAELRALAIEWVNAHKEPKVSYTVKSDVPQNLSINDIVRIKHPIVTIEARVQGYTYDTESERVKTLTFGNYDARLSTIYRKNVEERAESAMHATIEKVENSVNKNLSAWGADMAKMSALMSNSFGLYPIVVKSPNGSNVYYMGDRPTLEESTILWGMNAGAFSVSRDGGRTWTAGISADGSIAAHYMSTIGFRFDWAKGGQLTLGGRGNGSGLYRLYDAEGNLIIENDNEGLKAYAPNETIAKTTIDGSGVTTRQFLASEKIQMGPMKIIPRKTGGVTFQKASSSVAMMRMEEEEAEKPPIEYNWQQYNDPSILENLEKERTDG